MYGEWTKAVTTDEIPILYAGADYREKLKARVLEGLKNYEGFMDVTDLNIPYTSNDEEIFAIMDEILTEIEYEYPDIFYVEQAGISVYTEGEDGKLLKIRYNYNYGFTDTNPYFVGSLFEGADIVPEKVEACRKAIYKALSYVTDEMSTVEKLLVLHDYLVLNCEIDYKSCVVWRGEDITENTSWEDFSGYGALVNQSVRSVTSDAYAYAYQYLMQYILVWKAIL